MTISIINGANLNLLGKREPEVYGNIEFGQYLEWIKSRYNNLEIRHFQSNIEGELVDFIQKEGFVSEGLIINAGGYSHTSIVIADAIKAVPAKCVEVHISNLFRREQIRHCSLVSAYCNGSIMGLGIDGYRLAIEWFLNSK